MSNEPTTTPIPAEGRLEEAVALYLAAADAGRAPDRRDWLARYPELAGRLEAFFADQQQMERFAEPLLPPPGPGGWPEFDDFEVLEEIGRGGMGVVYKARQKSLPRLVALKVIRPGPGPGPEEHFPDEVRALARLNSSTLTRQWSLLL